ncbi:MAG: T9SS type A sorting domain-containing protein [Saprospiraceae bacterium]|nr:T9SS type A sorting domain-containing protein [Saprospiraceae bacterium]
MEEQRFVRPFATLLMAMTSCISLATTIVPYANLGSLADRSDALVMARVIRNYEHSENGQTLFKYRLIVEENLKGSLQEGDEFDVQKWEKLIDERWITMWGDLDFYTNARYLLFLERQSENLYHPLCYSYYVFEEISKEGETYIVPSPESREFELINVNDAEPLYVYLKDPLINQLTDYMAGLKGWSSDVARTTLDPETLISSSNKRSTPESCAFLTVNQRSLRWNNSPGQGVKIYYSGSGAGGCSSSVAQVQQAVLDISEAYEGVEISSGGSTSFVPGCSDATAVGPDFRSFMDDKLGGFRNVIIQFDDPCNEISDLKLCGGILALGGVYGVGTHGFMNETWATAKYGYVILNNGVGVCKCHNLRQILSHELTHSLGLGHISGSYGYANMNPDCCQAISSIDKTCVDYSYPPGNSPGLLPVELVNFEKNSDQVNNKVFWETTSVHDADKLNKKTSNPDWFFRSNGEVSSQEDRVQGQHFHGVDNNPTVTNDYPLRSIEYGISESKPQVYPTVANDFINIRIPNLQKETILNVFSISGKQIGDTKQGKDYTQLAVDFLPAGWYYLQIENRNYSEIFRFYKT